MQEYLHLIDTNTLGNRCDVTPLFSDPEAFSRLIDDLSTPFNSKEIDYIAGIDALGFIIGTAISIRFKKGFIPIRKHGKLPVSVEKREFVDYTGEKKALEIRKGIIKPGDRVLLVDEWIETGAQIRAAIDLIEQEGGVIIGITTINIDNNSTMEEINKKYNCHAIWNNMKQK
jgi:adenine phosphoribosyltransferase